MLVLRTNILLFYVQYLSILNLIGNSIARRRLEYSLPVLSQLSQQNGSELKREFSGWSGEINITAIIISYHFLRVIRPKNNVA